MSTTMAAATASGEETGTGTKARAVLLVGSAPPRGSSTSEALGRALLARLETRGFAGEIFWAARCRGESLAELTRTLHAADIFILAAPVYVDSLPHLVTAAMEHIARERASEPGARACRFVALLNCGFPEAAHTHVAQDICKLFAAAAGMPCTGTLGLGGGGALDGRPPDRLGWFARHVTRALDLTADALATGRPLPPKAVALMSRPLVPARGYTMIADRNWRLRARRHGVEGLLHARPYEQANPPVPPV